MRALLLFLAMTLPAAAASHLIYLGTYTRSTSKGIYAVRLDGCTGELSQPVLVAETVNPSFLALSPDRSHLYAVSESSTMAVPFATDLATGALKPLQAQVAADPSQVGRIILDSPAATFNLARTLRSTLGDCAARLKAQPK